MSDAHAGSPRLTKEFLASHGGPFYELQRRLHLLHEHALKSGQRAVIFVGLAWGVPSSWDSRSLSFDTSGGITYLADVSVWARFRRRRRFRPGRATGRTAAA